MIERVLPLREAAERDTMRLPDPGARRRRSADYIAMRECLVNLFIHQDYGDARTAGQIEITPDRAMFFNAGKSLVDDPALAEGGRSQSRNPLISRALRYPDHFH